MRIGKVLKLAPNHSTVSHHTETASLPAPQKIVQHEEPFLVSVASTTAMALPPDFAEASSDGADATATGFEAVSLAGADACFFGEDEAAAAACWGAEEAGAADCFGAAAGG